jgi:GH25 family lysozyme M1 (1,4-beta-N-acetylmuramidase)
MNAKLIDVSYCQSTINWARLREQNIGAMKARDD